MPSGAHTLIPSQDSSDELSFDALELAQRINRRMTDSDVIRRTRADDEESTAVSRDD